MNRFHLSGLTDNFGTNSLTVNTSGIQSPTPLWQSFETFIVIKNITSLSQLILVAHGAHGVSVKFFNWKEFFPIEYA